MKRARTRLSSLATIASLGLALSSSACGGSSSSGADDAAPGAPDAPTGQGPTVAFSAATSATADESAAVATVQVVLSTAEPLAEDVTVDVRDLESGTATADTDYTAFVTTTLTFAAGSTDGETQEVELSILADTDVEGDEDINLGLENVAGASLGSASEHTLTITDDDGELTGFAFLTGPVTAPAWEPQTVAVQLLDDAGAPIVGASVTLELATNPGQVLVQASHPGAGGVIQLIDPITPTLLNPIVFDDVAAEISGLLWDDATKQLFAIDRDTSTTTIDVATGAATTLAGSILTASTPRGFSLDGMGRVLAASAEDCDCEDLVSVDLATGDSTVVGDMTFAGDGVRTTNGIALDPVSGDLYACIETDAGDDQFRNLMVLDPTTLALTDVSRFGGGTTVEIPMADIAFFNSGTLYGLTGESSTLDGVPQETIVEINKADGTFVNILTLGQGDDGEALTAMPAQLFAEELTVVTDANGVATFTGVYLNAPASGYSLTAKVEGQTDIVSGTFDATAPIVSGVVELSAATSDVTEGDGTVTPCEVTITPAQNHDVFVWLSVDDDVVGSVDGSPGTGFPSTAGTDLGFTTTQPLAGDDDDQFLVRIPAGATSVPVQFDLVDDAVTEVSETFTFYIGNELGVAGSVGLATPGAQLLHTMTIADND